MVRFNAISNLFKKRKNNTYFSSSICPDQFVGTVDNTSITCMNNNKKQTKYFNLPTKNNWNASKRKNVFTQNNPNSLKLEFRNPVIVLLVESPHRDEYASNNGLGIDGPILGSTGDQFNSYFLQAINNSCNKISNNIYDIVIMNAVQHQCSLGNKLDNKKNIDLRDFVFGRIFNDIPPYNSMHVLKNGMDDLIDRLKLLEPDYVLNCVTKNLKNVLVQNQLLALRLPTSISFLSASHPLRWNRFTEFK